MTIISATQEAKTMIGRELRQEDRQGTRAGG